MREPLVSIIVTNFNYARFLPRSIDSALTQSYSRVEVVVVDDASSDGSQQVIEGYAGRVVPVLQKRNAGQGAAFNAGFRASRGEIVIFLDADDYLLPNAAARVVDAFRPGVAKVQYRLNLTDSSGRIVDVYPPPEVALDSGDVVPLLLSRGRYETPVTTGNAFDRSVLETILPIPEQEFRISADGYLVTVAPLFGAVVSIEEPLGAYVQHGANQWGSSANVSAERFRKSLAHDGHKLKALQTWAARRGLSVADSPELNDPFHLSNRLASLCLEPAQHPHPDDSRLRIALKGATSALRRRAGLRQTALVATWFLAAGLTPEAVARRVVSWRLIESSRPAALDRLLKRVRRVAFA